MSCGLNPGPVLFTDQKDFVWTLFGSMYVGNILAVIPVLLTVPAFAALMPVPFYIIAPLSSLSAPWAPTRSRILISTYCCWCLDFASLIIRSKKGIISVSAFGPAHRHSQ